MIIKKDPVQDMIGSINSIKESLPKRQRQLCDFIIKNYQTIGMLTVKELADQAGVGTSTVLRVMQALGYSNFYEMRKNFHDVSVSSGEKFEYVRDSFANKSDVAGNSASQTLTAVWEESVHLLGETLDLHFVEQFQKAMELILRASRINLLGFRPYRATAIYMELLMEEFYSNTRQLSYDSDALYDRILQFQQDEVLIVFAFEPYTIRTLEAAELTHERGVPVILITDHLSCPIVSFADVTLKVETSKKHFSIVPIIALIEALVIELGKRTSETSIQKVKQLGRVLKEKKVTRS